MAYRIVQSLAYYKPYYANSHQRELSQDVQVELTCTFIANENSPLSEATYITRPKSLSSSNQRKFSNFSCIMEQMLKQRNNQTSLRK